MNDVQNGRDGATGASRATEAGRKLDDRVEAGHEAVRDARTATGLQAETSAATETSPAAEAPTNPKLAQLTAWLQQRAPLAIGFSGGVDSTFLAAACTRCIPEQTLLVHIVSPFITTPELQSCEREAQRLNLPIVHIPFDPLAYPRIIRNGPDRCYHCKRAIFEQVIAVAREHGCSTVADGSNADDSPADRPGMRALAELGVSSPLRDTGWRKREERDLLRGWGHEVWNLPAGACLATRVAAGEPLSARALGQVHAAEDYLHELGLAQVRVRLAGGTARIQAGERELAALANMAARERPASSKNAENDRVTIPQAIAAHLETLGLHLQDGDAIAPYRTGA